MTLASLAELADLRARLASEERERARPTLILCAGTGGQASGSNDIMRVVKKHILENRLQDRIRLRVTGCQGFCEMDPFIIVEPGRALYPRLAMSDVPRIIEAALSGREVHELLYREPGAAGPCRECDDIPFFRGQKRTILGLNEKIDPIRITDYLAHGGYAALETILADPDPEAIIAQVKASGLRGRGGAGFPTGRKWELARAAGSPGVQKYLICNADEGDPGAYMNRCLLEGNPHQVLEGMIIAGIAIGATRGVVYVRTEYPLAIKHARVAIDQARRHRLLGEDILGTGIAFEVEIVRGAGAFVCGEETALIASVEGRRGTPRPRPPFPVQRGLWGHPTCINNVETLANIPPILRDGGVAYGRTGSAGNTGTKIFSLVGKIRNSGLVEVPLGTPIRVVVETIGGGAPDGRRVKAIQTGGPSGGCIPEALFDTPIDYDSLARLGSIMGSGGIIVMDEDTCVVDIARYFLKFTQEESCGKCPPCRVGTRAMLSLLDRIAGGTATLQDLAKLEELAWVVRSASLCGLGQTAPNPVATTLRYFRDEYLAHVTRRECPAFVCGPLIGYRIDPVRCNGCGACRRACPAGAIEGRQKTPHAIDGSLCTRCGTCFTVCPARIAAVDRASGGITRPGVPRPPATGGP